MAKPIDLDMDEIRRLYLEERVAEREIAGQFGVNRQTIRLRLLWMGITPRGTSEANLIRYERASPEEWARLAEHGRRVLAATPRTIESRRKAARTVYANQRLSIYERLVLDKLRERGIPAEGLWPLEGTNIDVAIPSAKIAVEIHGGWHGTKKKRAADARKAALCSTHGWDLLVFDRQSATKTKRAPEVFCGRIVDLVSERYHRGATT